MSIIYIAEQLSGSEIYQARSSGDFDACRTYFHDHPEVAIQLLSQLRNDESELARKFLQTQVG